MKIIQYNDKRNASVDLCRALSMLYIAGYWHMVPYSGGYPGFATILTECIKDIVLGAFAFSSGMVLHMDGDKLNFTTLLTFYQQRLIRIYPLYLLALGLFLKFHIINLKVFIYSAILISVFNGYSPYTLWFIPMIMAFYLAAPILLRFSQQIRLYLAASAGIAAFLIFIQMKTKGVDPRLIQYLPCFIAGIQWRTFRHLHERPEAGKIRSMEIISLLLMIPSAYLYLQANHSSFTAAFSRIPIILSGAVFFHLMAERITVRFHPRIVFHGAYASFCVYLFHRPIVLFISSLYIPESPFFRLLYLMGLVLPIIFIASYYIQRIYDRQIRPLILHAVSIQMESSPVVGRKSRTPAAGTQTTQKPSPLPPQSSSLMKNEPIIHQQASA